MLQEVQVGVGGGGIDLASPDLHDEAIFSASNSNPTKAIPVTQKPRYVMICLSSSIPTNYINIIVTLADKNSDSSKTLVINSSDIPLEYNTVGMKTDDILGGCGLISVTDNAVNIKGQTGYACKVITSIWY